MKKNCNKVYVKWIVWILGILTISINIFSAGILYAEEAAPSVGTRKVKLFKIINGAELGAPKNISNPFNVYADTERNLLYIVASDMGPIYRFDIADNYKFVGTIADSPDLKLRYILDVITDKNGNIYVVDSMANKIHVFDNQGTLKQTITPRDSRTDASAICIVGIAFSSKGDIYLADKAGYGIQVLDWEGNYLYQVKRARLDQIDFGFPSVSGIKINSQDEIFLFDNLMSKIIKFNLKGKTLAIFGGRGDVAGKFIDAAGLAVDSKDRIYVVETSTGTVQVFDKDGNFLHILVNESGGRLALKGPERIAFDAKGNMYVLERIHSRVSAFQFID